MKDCIFLNLAFGDYRYTEQQERCNASIRAIYPDANIKSWTNEYPPGSRTHRESLYGFKVHAIRWAMEQGYSKIIWVDTAVILQKEVDYWFTLIPKYGVIAAKDDNKLINFTAPQYRFYVQDHWHLCGGSLYVFDMAKKLSYVTFHEWAEFERRDFFGSQQQQASGKINSHRHDETMLAISLYQSGTEPTPYDVCRYNNGSGSIVTKQHFK